MALERVAATAESPCGRTGCGTSLLCCRPDCPLVTVDIGPGLKRIYTRADFVACVRSAADGMGLDVAAIEAKARRDAERMIAETA